MMNSRLNQFLEWLQQSGGSFKGQPIPNFAFLLLLIVFFIQAVIFIFNKIKKNRK